MDQVTAVQGREFYRLAQLFDRSDDLPVAQVRLIRQALRQAHTAETGNQTRLTTAEAARIIAAAGRRLLARKDQFAAALTLARNLPGPLADLQEVAVLRCRALIHLRQRDEAVTEADRLLALSPPDAARDRAVVDLLTSVLLHHDLRADFRRHDLIWGVAGATVTDTLQSLDAAPYYPAIDGPLLPYLLGVRQQPEAETPALRDALAWGLAASYYRKFLSNALTDLRQRRLTDPEAASGLSEAYHDSCSRLTAAPPDPALQALVAQGRSVVLLQSHSGARGVISQSLADLDCPLSMVGKGSRVVRDREGDFSITTGTATDLPLQFLKLAKLARKGPRVIRLLPDGRDGSEFGEIDLFGRKVTVGLGGASLALLGKAVLAFAKTRWTGAGWAVEVTVGPDLALARDRAAAEALFLEFYAENLRQILRGPARDIGGTGGYLVSLRKGGE